MTVQIAMASHDENGRYSGGIAGDQTGQEVQIRNWYSRPWDVVIRARNSAVASRIAQAMEQAAMNPHIGYDQSQRVTLYQAAAEVNWNLSAIMTFCECDCSSLVAVAINAAGIRVPKDLTTRNMREALAVTGQFLIFSGAEYTASQLLLQRGDILLNVQHHVAVVTKGMESSSSAVSVIPYAVTVTASDYLQCRTEPSSSKGIATEYKVGGQSKRLCKNECISIWKEAYDEKGQKWGAINAITPLCWISLKYVKR